MFLNHRSATLALAVVVPLVACNKTEEPAVVETVSVTEGPDSTFYIEDDIWTALAGLPHEHLAAARQHFMDRQWDAVQSDLTRSAAFLKLQAKDATQEDRARLRADARMLDEMASQVEKRAVTDVASLDQVLGSAYSGLARHYGHRAEAAWSADRLTTAVVYVREAALEAERGFERAGVMIDAESRKALDDAKGVTALDTPAVISERLGQLNTVIGKLEAKVRPVSSS